MFKSIFKAVAVSAVAAFFCVGCSDKNNGGGEEPGDNPGEGGGSKSSYTVTFNPNGGTVSPTSAKTGDDGKLDSLPTPTRDGYTFDGWYTAATGGTAVAAGNVYTANTTIYARWTEKAVNPPDTANPNDTTGGGINNPNDTTGGGTDTTGGGTKSSYTVTFDANDGTVSPTSDTTGADGKLASLPTATRTGYTLDGWYTAQTGGTKVEAGKVYTENTTVYARWTEVSVTPSTYTITFNPYGGTVSPTSAKTGDDGKLTSLPEPTRGGYAFNGWFTESTGGTEVAASRVYTANTTIYARWGYRITLDPNGGTVNPTSAITDSDGRLKSQPTPTIENNNPLYVLVFVGWYTTKSADGTFVSEYNYRFSTNATVYARWSAAYVITFDAGGGTVSRDSDTTFATSSGSGGKLKSYPPTPTKSGYTFLGWFFVREDNGQEMAFDESMVFNRNTTLFAKWSSNARSVSFDANGGSGSVPFMTVPAAGSAITLPSGDGLTMAGGYTFGGWNTNSSGTGTNYDAGASYTVTGSVTLYAKWTNSYVYTGETVTIGTQTWMAENLNRETANSKCYNNIAGNCESFGRLYNWNDALTACPVGWHLPTDAEWTTLTDYVGTNAGKKLKATSGWGSSASYNGTDDYGFSALPGGYGNSDGSFNSAGDNGYWWSATEFGAGIAWCRYVHYNGEGVYRHYAVKSGLSSVRCLQD